MGSLYIQKSFRKLLRTIGKQKIKKKKGIKVKLTKAIAHPLIELLSRNKEYKKQINILRRATKTDKKISINNIISLFYLSVH